MAYIYLGLIALLIFGIFKRRTIICLIPIAIAIIINITMPSQVEAFKNDILTTCGFITAPVDKNEEYKDIIGRDPSKHPNEDLENLGDK